MNHTGMVPLKLLNSAISISYFISGKFWVIFSSVQFTQLHGKCAYKRKMLSTQMQPAFQKQQDDKKFSHLFVSTELVGLLSGCGYIHVFVFVFVYVYVFLFLFLF